MKKIVYTGFILAMALFFGVMAIADETPDKEAAGEEAWAGTWSDANFTVIIEQNGSEITATGIPHENTQYIPFLLSGVISDDGTTLLTVMKTTGILNIVLSDDQMEYSGIQTVDPELCSGKHCSHTYHATRNGSLLGGDVWSGEWVTPNGSITLNQTGNAITGTYYSFIDPEFLQELQGSASEDGKSLFLNWSTSEAVNFILSDDDMHLIENECGDEEIANGEICFNLTKQG
ncbi:MAG: hypothetical protein JXA44_07250 [Methanospirillaceae archaeon]|nr:hypothetical protein [Methanospirillaceae archaeon]